LQSSLQETIIERVSHLDRSYERIEENLTVLGARIQRFPSEQGTR